MNITAVIVAVLLASVITAVGGFWLLPMLRRLHFGQTILEIGPKWHQGKQGTPTMGGLMFIIGIPIAVVVAYLFMHASTVGDPMSAIMRARMFYGLVLALLFGAIGFLDDYLKVVKKQNEGLTEKQKMALQILFGAVYLLLLHISGTQSTMVTIPYIGTYDFGVFYYVFAMFAIIAPVSLHVPSIISQKNINTYFRVRYAHNTYINNTAKGYSICIVVDKPRKIG